MASTQNSFQYTGGVQAEDGYWRPCYKTCVNQECGQPSCRTNKDSEPHYRVYNLNPGRLSTTNLDEASYLIPKSLLDTQLETNPYDVKFKHYYYDTHFKPPSDLAALADDMDAFAPAYGDACIRIDPCVDVPNKLGMCCKTLAPPPIYEATDYNALSKQIAQQNMDFAAKWNELVIPTKAAKQGADERQRLVNRVFEEQMEDLRHAKEKESVLANKRHNQMLVLLFIIVAVLIAAIFIFFLISSFLHARVN